MMIAWEIGRRQPSSFDGGGGRTSAGSGLERRPRSVQRRPVWGISLLWLAFIALQMRITQAKIGNYILNISFNYVKVIIERYGKLRACQGTNSKVLRWISGQSFQVLNN